MADDDKIVTKKAKTRTNATKKVAAKKVVKKKATATKKVAASRKVVAKKAPSTTQRPTSRPATTTNTRTAAPQPTPTPAAPSALPLGARPATRKITAVSPEQREAMIQEAAYYKAEKRNFAPGFEAQDWAEATREVDEQLSKS